MGLGTRLLNTCILIMCDMTDSPALACIAISVGEDIPALFLALILMVRLHILSKMIRMSTGWPGW